jgi:hypothetical protein
MGDVLTAEVVNPAFSSVVLFGVTVVPGVGVAVVLGVAGELGVGVIS